MSKVEQTLSLIKPDAVERNLEEEIKQFFIQSGFTITKQKKVKLEKKDAEIFYKVHETKPFYVGKGKNKRDLQHKSGNYDSKQKKIQEIEKRGKKVYRVIIGRYETEEEALSVEATLIKWVFLSNSAISSIKSSIFLKLMADITNFL